MKIKALIANDDMDVHQLMHDILEIIFRDVEIDRALSPQSFWAKATDPYHIVFLSVDFIAEAPEPEGFIERLKAANPDTLGNVVITGDQHVFDTCADDVKQLPFLARPFSLDDFEGIIKTVNNGR